MRRLVWALAGRTYPIVGNLMSRLKCLDTSAYLYMADQVLQLAVNIKCTLYHELKGQVRMLIW